MEPQGTLSEVHEAIFHCEKLSEQIAADDDEEGQKEVAKLRG